jgi:hypothetical protein
MELPSGREWEIPRIHGDSLFSQGAVLKLLWLLSLVLTGMYWGFYGFWIIQCKNVRWNFPLEENGKYQEYTMIHCFLRVRS